MNAKYKKLSYYDRKKWIIGTLNMTTLFDLIMNVIYGFDKDNK